MQDLKTLVQYREREMCYALRVHVFQTPQNLPDVTGYICLCEVSPPREIIQQFSSASSELCS